MISNKVFSFIGLPNFLKNNSAQRNCMGNKSLRITKNTFLLYFRLFFILIINLISVRLLLDTLGESDYGIYNVVAGIVTMLTFVTTALQTSTQRYYSFSLGKEEDAKLKEIFSASLEIFIIISILFLLIGESVGLWFINTQLTIPPERIHAANIVYQFTVLSFVLSIITIPYSSAVIANEDMNIYAIVSILEGVFKFIVVILLYCIPCTIDKLIIYALLLFIVHFIKEAGYIAIARKKYKECSYLRKRNNIFRKSIFSFAGWTMYGSLAGVLNTQGNTILINIFFGTIATASRAVSLQISNAISSLVSGFVTAIKPPIVKSFAENNYEYAMRVFNFGNKFILYSLLIFCIPMYMEMETILTLWLKEVSLNTIIFSKLILIYTTILCLHHPITILMQAIGNIKPYYLYVDTLTLLSLPLTYISFKNGFEAAYSYYIMIAIFLVAHIMRILILKKNFNFFSVRKYLINFLLLSLSIIVMIVLILRFFAQTIEGDMTRLMCSFLITTILIIFFAYSIALSKEEKKFIRNLISTLKNKNVQSR